MNKSYTQVCKEALQEIRFYGKGTDEYTGCYDEYADDPIEQVQDFLSEMAPFGERLKIFIASECGIEQTQAQRHLKESYKQKGVNLNDNTIKNWFSKAGPKKGDHSRDNMLKIAFALGLDLNQTNRLFHEVYLDRSLDLRRPEETAAYFCLSNGQGWTEFQQLARQLQPDWESPQEGTVLTTVMQKDLDALQTAEQLRQYVRLHPHNFQIRSRSAADILKKLLAQVRGNKEKTGEIDIELSERDKEDGLLEILRGHPRDSIETMVRVIIDAAPAQPGKRAILSGSVLPQEIRTNFPEPAVFSKKNPSYEELRKMIILLASYLLWRQALRSTEEVGFDEYKDCINDQLGEAGMAPLYCGNPFDWIFLVSAIQEKPLDCLRSILCESLEPNA